jgi:hypothetical protein
MNTLTRFSNPQTLKLISYIKHRKFITLVDSVKTHNCIHCHISQEINCYIRAFNNFQIMIANGDSMKCGGHCENLCIEIHYYHPKYHMFFIDIGGCDIFLSSKWICTLIPITVDFKDLTMQFQ